MDIDGERLRERERSHELVNERGRKERELRDRCRERVGKNERVTD